MGFCSLVVSSIWHGPVVFGSNVQIVQDAHHEWQSR
ncbi:MAG: hypothetical protein ACI8W3_003350, partial [Myxococcota bacterium]